MWAWKAPQRQLTVFKGYLLAWGPMPLLNAADTLVWWVSSDTKFSTLSMLAMKRHYLFSKFWFPSKGKFAGKWVAVTLQAGEEQALVESWQAFSSPASGKKIAKTKPMQTGRRQREVERDSPCLCQGQATSWDCSKQLLGIALGSGFGFVFAVWGTTKLLLLRVH